MDMPLPLTDIRATRSRAIDTKATRDTLLTPVLRAHIPATRDSPLTPVVPAMGTKSAHRILPIPVPDTRGWLSQRSPSGGLVARTRVRYRAS
jgi:hypothetical protein